MPLWVSCCHVPLVHVIYGGAQFRKQKKQETNKQTENGNTGRWGGEESVEFFRFSAVPVVCLDSSRGGLVQWPAEESFDRPAGFVRTSRGCVGHTSRAVLLSGLVRVAEVPPRLFVVEGASSLVEPRGGNRGLVANRRRSRPSVHNQAWSPIPSPIPCAKFSSKEYPSVRLMGEEGGAGGRAVSNRIAASIEWGTPVGRRGRCVDHEGCPNSKGNLGTMRDRRP